MKNLKRSILSLLLVLVFVVSSFVPSFAAESQPSKYSKEYNSGQRGVVCTTLDGTSASSYYTGSYTYDRLSTQSKDTIKSSLTTLMTTTHTYKSSYNDCHYEAHRTDCENETGSSEKLLLIYTSYTATQSQWNGWNREHVWPQSLGGGNTSGGGADLHHVRPSDASVNSSRGNKKYGNVDGGTAKYGNNPATGYLGGHYDSTYFEPLDEVKGDVARICLYVWVRWGSSWGADSVTEVFQSIDVLLEWCELDPVDTWEMGRNEVVQDIQGNRNVFIDYPEYAWLIFGREVPSSMQTPSGEASGSTSGGGSTPVCTHTNTTIKNAVSATCLSTGYTGDTYCVSCGVKISEGTTTAKGSHSWGEWVINVEAGTKTRTCIYNCGASQTGTVTTTCTHATRVTKNAVDPTCTQPGYSGDVYCSSCNAKLSTGTTLSATGHSWSDWYENTSAGEKSRECQTCGETEYERIEIPTCTHSSTEIKNATSATCGSAGYTGDTYCKTCGDKLSTGSVIAATGDHTWGDMVVTLEPTEERDGEGVCTCQTCGATETIVIEYIPEEPKPDDPSVDIPAQPDPEPEIKDIYWGYSYSTEAEQIIAVISKNAIYSFVVSLLTKV